MELLQVLKSSEEMQASFRKYSKSIPVDLSSTKINDDDLLYLVGAHNIDLHYCEGITNNGLKYLQSAKTINLGGCHISNEGLKHLKSVTNIRLSFCNIRDKDLEYFQHVESINISQCDRITDEGLKHLKAVPNINLSFCCNITDKGLEYLKCVESIDLFFCRISKSGLNYLKSIGCKIYI
jgi:hypothetical protein